HMPPEETSRFSADLKAAYKASGPKGYWRKTAELLTVFLERTQGPKPPLSVVAGYWVQAGETDKAFALLEKDYQERGEGLLFIKGWQFDPIKSDPRYKDLLRRVGLPQD